VAELVQEQAQEVAEPDRDLVQEQAPALVAAAQGLAEQVAVQVELVQEQVLAELAPVVVQVEPAQELAALVVEQVAVQEQEAVLQQDHNNICAQRKQINLKLSLKRIAFFMHPFN
jgi:hypothetical protein